MRVTFMLAVLIVGCSSEKPQQLSSEAAEAVQVLGKDQIDPVRLKNRLLMFADRFSAELAGTGTTIAQRTDDSVVREQTIQWRIRFIPLMYMAVRDSDPRAGFLEAWTGCVHMQRYFTQGGGKNWFGDQQQLAIDCADRLVKDVVAVGKQSYPEAAIESARKDVEGFALSLPDSYASVGFATRSPAAQEGGLANLLSIPLAPVKGLQGVGDTPSSIVHAAETAEHLGQLLQGMPEQARWQVELLFLELQSLQAVTEFRQDLNQVSQSIASIAATAETLPQDIKALPEDIQKQVAKTIEDARATINEVDGVLTNADKVATSIDGTSQNLRETAVALQATVDTVDAIIMKVMPAASASKPTSGTPAVGSGDTIGDILKTSEELHATVLELRGLVGEVDSDKLTAVLDNVDQTSRGTIDYALKRGLYTGLILIGAFLVAQLLYRLVATRLLKPAVR